MKLFNTFLKIGFIVLLISQVSCRKDFETQVNNGNLSFSKDTLFLDTVFNDLSTSTHLLKVYNSSKNDIRIPSIKLEKNNSKYRFAVDGIPGTEFKDVIILKNDSIFIKIEATISSSDSDDKMIYEDNMLFSSSDQTQKVNLVSLVQDATFLFNKKNEDFDLEIRTFSNKKPYVVYGNAIVPKNGNLDIEAGTIVYFSKNSSLKISEGATLNILGTLTDSIVFKGNNLSYQFDRVPGQWEGITIEKNSQVSINHLKLLNSSTGINITDNINSININNTEIHNTADYGIYTQNAVINAQNLIIGHAGKSALYLQGGSYNFNHTTIANYWSNSIRTKRNVVLKNYYTENNTKINAPLNQANFTNSIIAGTKNNEVFLDKIDEEPTFNFNFKNCLLNTEKGEILYNTEDLSLYTNVLLNKKLDFRNTRLNDFRIGLDNEGINKADPASANLTPIDIIGTDRSAKPDIGAYQHIDFNTLESEKDKKDE